jgi:hypothetical protein
MIYIVLINAIFLLVSDFPDAEFHESTHECKGASHPENGENKEREASTNKATYKVLDRRLISHTNSSFSLADPLVPVQTTNT